MSLSGDVEPSSRVEAAKRSAAEAAAARVLDGMTVGLGTGSTVAYLLPALAERAVKARYVATSVSTETLGRSLGLDIVAFDTAAPGTSTGIERLDLAIDGADQVSPENWLVKGGGGAHVREKVVAAAAERFVVIVSPEKLVEAISPPVPVEILAFGAAATLRALGDARVRPGAPPSPDGGLIADWYGGGALVGDTSERIDPEAVASYLDSVPGVVGHGLFPPSMVSEVIVGGAD